MNLRGFDPSGAPAAPAEAIRGFLDALGVPPERIPPGPDAQAALYRSLLADKRMLIVLDNARDEQQVRPLLPASPASLVLVTSRNQLAGLAAADGARLVSLDVLTHDEAVAAAHRPASAPRRADAEPGAVGEIAVCVRTCRWRWRSPPPAPPPGPASRWRPWPPSCATPAGRLDALDAGDPAASVAGRVLLVLPAAQPRGGAACSGCLACTPAPTSASPPPPAWPRSTSRRARRLLRELTRDCPDRRARTRPVRLPRPAPRLRRRPGPRPATEPEPRRRHRPDPRPLPAHRQPRRRAASARLASRSPSHRQAPVPARSAPPITGRPWPGSRPSTRSCSPPSPLPPKQARTATPGSSPGR